MKICHMTSAHNPEDVRIFHKECVSLAKSGYETYLVQQGESYEKNGVHMIGVGNPSGGRLNRMTSFAKKVYMAALALDADLYHFHDPELLPWGLKLKKKGKKVIFDSHEIYTVQIRLKPYLPRWSRSLVAACYAFYERQVLQAIDGLIIPALMWDGHHPLEGKCSHLTMLNNVPLLNEFYDHYSPSASKTERSVVHIGSLAHSRGITHLIKAAAKANSIVYLAGPFIPADYQAEIESLPEYSCVRYLGKLSRSQVLETLQTCQIGMATLLNVGQYDKLGNLATKVYEYMSLGLPVILSKTPYNQKAVEKYHFGICVDPEDINETASAICYLFDNPEEARQMGENGRKAVKEEFNWSVEEKKLLTLYEEILRK